MFPYWLIYGIWATGAVHFSRKRFDDTNRNLFTAAAVVTALFIGLRFQVGGDWGSYLNIYNQIYFQPLATALTLTDPGYAALNWSSVRLGQGIWLVNFGCAILFMVGVARLASVQPNPWLAILIAVPYLIIVVAMGYTRQAAAIGIVCYGLADANERAMIRLVVIVGLAAMFHKTALLMLPVMLAPIATRKPLVGVVGCLLFALLFTFLLRGTSDQLIAGYAQSNYDSQGAAIRIGMNVLAALVLLTLRRRMDLTDYQRSFWTYNALLALASVPMLIILPASSGVDRLSLFLIPMQLVALSHLPTAWATTRGGSAFLTLGVIGYAFAIEFVWLNYASNAFSWLPYSTVVAPASQF